MNDRATQIDKFAFEVPFVCGATNLQEVRRAPAGAVIQSPQELTARRNPWECGSGVRHSGG